MLQYRCNIPFSIFPTINSLFITLQPTYKAISQFCGRIRITLLRILFSLASFFAFPSEVPSPTPLLPPPLPPSQNSQPEPAPCLPLPAAFGERIEPPRRPGLDSGLGTRRTSERAAADRLPLPGGRQRRTVRRTERVCLLAVAGFFQFGSGRQRGRGGTNGLNLESNILLWRCIFMVNRRQILKVTIFQPDPSF